MDQNNDVLLRFLLPTAGVRGAIVRLGASWRELASHGAPDPASARLLGEACAAAALLSGHVKVEGRLSIQLRGGPIATLFAEATVAGTLRGIVRLRDGATAPTSNLTALGEDALLAITVENPSPGGRDPSRYQGLVTPQAARLDQVLEAYFSQSEQLPTRLHLACDNAAAAGLLLQKLPGGEDDADGFRRASILLATLREDELLALPPREVVRRLFHEEAPDLLGEASLRFGCSCSRERVADVLLALGRAEADAAVAAGTGAATIGCEFCGRTYRFDAGAIAELFARHASALPGAPGVQ